MRDVAERAGVSKATVSYVLNGRGAAMRIGEETRQRILHAMRELDYSPNGLARSLAQRTTQTVAVVMQYPRLFSGGSGFTNELMRGITDAAVTQGYDVLLHTRAPDANWRGTGEAGTENAVETEVANLTDGRVDGALLLRDVNDPLAERLQQRGFPAVLMFTHPNDEAAGQWYVDCDNVLGGRLATEHLIDLGHRRIAHLAGPSGSGAGRERQAGYGCALAQAGIAVHHDWIVEAPGPSADLGRAACWFDAPPDQRPTAVFAWSDDVALQMLRVLRQTGLHVPDDVALVGFDSTALCEHTDPPLTSVHQPVYAMAARAMELLAQRLRGETPEESQLRFAPELAIRRSCGASAPQTNEPRQVEDDLRRGCAVEFVSLS